MMTHTEKKQLPLGVGDDVRTYDEGKWVKGKVTEVGESSFIVEWEDLTEETIYEWQEVTIKGNIIIE